MSIFGQTINTSEIAKVSSWKFYTPTIIGNNTSSTPSGRYFILGKLVFVQISFKILTLLPGPSILVKLPFDFDHGTPNMSGPGWGLSSCLVGFIANSNGFIIGQLQPNQGYAVVTTVTGATPAVTGQSYSLSGWYPRL